MSCIVFIISPHNVTPSDQIGSLFKIKNYSYNFNISADGVEAFSATTLGVSSPTGYTPIALRRVTVKNDSSYVGLYWYNAAASGSSTVIKLANWDKNNARTGTLEFSIVYVRSDVIETLT